MQTNRDVKKNEAERRVDRSEGHTEEPGDQAAASIHEMRSNLLRFIFYLVAVLFVFFVFNSCLGFHFSILSPFSPVPWYYTKFLGAFAKFRKAIINVSTRPSLSIE